MSGVESTRPTCCGNCDRSRTVPVHGREGFQGDTALYCPVKSAHMPWGDVCSFFLHEQEFSFEEVA